MPRCFGVFVLLLVSVSILRAQGDVTLLTVGSDVISKDEFVYHLGQSGDTRIEPFLETYIRFRKKLLYAKELGLDTLFKYRQQKMYYQELMKRDSEKVQIPSSCKSHEWIKLVHVTYPLRQQASNNEIRKGESYIDSIYHVILKNGFPADVLESYSWEQSRFLLNEWRIQLEKLEAGQISEPFYSPLGIHLIAWLDKKREGSGGKKQPDRRWQEKEIEEAMLVAILEDYLQRAFEVNEAELEDYFKRHREAYGWGIPHFRGAIVHCQNKKDAKVIKKLLKKYPETLWPEIGKMMLPEMRERFRMEVGLFAIGVNAYVDKLAFNCGSFESLADYPYTWVFGKKLKKGPESYKDVRSRLEKDCKKAKKIAERESIEQKYEVEIDEEVLKTVNHAVNK